MAIISVKSIEKAIKIVMDILEKLDEYVSLPSLQKALIELRYPLW